MHSISTLLVKNIRTFITCDETDRIPESVDLYCEDGFIKEIGPALPFAADTVIDGSHFWCYPGLVNIRHHLYQVLKMATRRRTRCCAAYLSAQ